ncbi:MAG: hypothetical protein R3Y23_01420, partial [Bacillota bacterium]
LLIYQQVDKSTNASIWLDKSSNSTDILHSAVRKCTSCAFSPLHIILLKTAPQKCRAVSCVIYGVYKELTLILTY